MLQQPLNRAFNVAVRHCAMKCWPLGFDVAETAPDSLESLTSEIANRGRMTVWRGASEHTIFACADTNWHFRAWHDWHHWRWQLPFTLEGEKGVALAQCRDLVALYGLGASREFRRLVWAEVVGQAAYKERHGEFPPDQVAFVRAFLNL